jgi:hypothetical protein
MARGTGGTGGTGARRSHCHIRWSQRTEQHSSLSRVDMIVPSTPVDVFQGPNTLRSAHSNK